MAFVSVNENKISEMIYSFGVNCLLAGSVRMIDLSYKRNLCNWSVNKGFTIRDLAIPV